MTNLATVTDIAARLGLSYDYTRKLIRDSGIQPVHVIGRSHLYTEEQINALRP